MIRITSGTEETESMLNIPAKSYEDRLELVAELNSQISVNGALKNKVLFKTNELGELILRSVEGGDQVSIEVDNADPNVNVASRLGFLLVGTVETGVRASDTDALNDLANIGADLTDGDVIRFTGIVKRRAL